MFMNAQRRRRGELFASVCKLKNTHPLSAHDNLGVLEDPALIPVITSETSESQFDRCQPAITCRVSAVHHAAGHVLAMTRIALHHHGSWLKDRHGDLCHRQLLMVCLLRRDDWSIGGEHEVNPRIWNKICLEFSDVHVERTIKAQRSCP